MKIIFFLKRAGQSHMSTKLQQKNPELIKALEIIQRSDFFTYEDTAVYVGPHIHKQDYKDVLDYIPNSKTVWDTQGGQIMQQMGWFGKGSQFDLHEQAELFQAALTKFVESTTGTFFIIGIDPKITGYKSSLYQTLKTAIMKNDKITGVGNFEKDAWFSLFEADKENFKNKNTGVVKPDEESWKQGRIIMRKSRKANRQAKP